VIERRLEQGAFDGALALTLGRAGRQSSSAILARWEADEEIARLARGLLAPRPGRLGVERADSGYRFGELFVEDPLAVHWHHRGAWGPPIRPDPMAPTHFASDDDDVERLFARVREGELVIVGFAGTAWSRPPDALRLTLAGLGRAPDLRGQVRWRSVRSVGWQRGWRGQHLAYETADGGRNTIIGRPIVAPTMLLSLFERLMAESRG